MWRGSEQQEEELEDIEHLNSITRRLDELARELDEREGEATDADIAAFKHRLSALAREIDQRPLPETELDETDGYSDPPARQIDPRASHAGDRVDFGKVGRCALPVAPPGPRQNEALAVGLSAINALVNSMAPRRDPQQSQVSVHALHECVETGALERDQQFPTATERWLATSDREPGQAGSPEDRLRISASDRVLPPISSAPSVGAVNKRLPWSTMAPFAKAILAAILAITVVVTGAYFVRSRAPGSSASMLMTAIFKERAPAIDAAAPRSLGITPQNTLARFQEQVFQLPNLYGIYAINSDKLFELEALPGQVPDRRVPVSAVIPQPSRTTLPDGRIAFLVFRRDVATSISERVPIRIVAKIRRKIANKPTGERGSPEKENAWTIRNIAFDFRVAPVEQNKEMVLLRPENSGFTFPAGRYALILKGQAYDFAVAGAVVDTAQCLERVEASNGSFLHECQQPEAGTTSPSFEKSAPPQRSRLSSKMPRPGELHAPVYD